MAVPSRAWMSRSRCRIWAWMVTSSAVVGSSAISTLGWQASAIAIMARWRMPPDSWYGYSCTRRAGSEICTRSSSRSACASASRRDRPWCSVSDSAIWRPMVNTGLSEVIGSWKIIDSWLPRMARMASRAAPADPGPRIRWRRRRRDRARAASHDGQRGDALAAAGFADQAQRLAGQQIERQAVDGHRGGLVAIETGGQVAHAQHGFGSHGRS